MQRNSQDILKLTNSLVQVYELLRVGEPIDHEGRALHFLHLNQKMNPQQEEARNLVNDVIDSVSKGNRQLSKALIVSKIIYKTIGHALWFPGDITDIHSFIEQSLQELLTYDAHRSVDIPVVYLDPGMTPLKFGLVTFNRFTSDDKATTWWKTIKSIVGDRADIDVVSYARAISVGDHQKSLDNADFIVDETLTLLRAIGFPITTKDELQFGVINDFPLSQTRPYRSGKTIEKHRLEGSVQSSLRLGPGIATYNIRDLLSKVDSFVLENIQRLIESDFLNPQSPMKKKFFLGLHWLGEATKPDSNEGRFAKLAFALEGLIGGDANQETFSTRGLTATLAERAAFLAGNDLDERKIIHAEVFKFYGARSGIVHGGDKRISDEQIMGFAALVRKVAWALLNRIDDFKDIDSLQSWVLSQRYT